VALDIDPTQPFRSHERLVALIKAVFTAEPTDEAVWLEWKSPLDLRTPEGQFSVARQILGFANRPPEVAAPWAGGHAYLVVGAEPGSLAGMTPIDPAVLEPMIRPWVGTGPNSPRWHPTWVVVDGLSVLVVDVGPPRPGDAVLPLRKSHPRARAGTILVRNLGSVDPAGPADVDALSARAGAGRRRVAVEVYAKPGAEPLRALRYRKEDVDAWVEQRRQALLRSLSPSPPPEPPGLAEPGARFRGIEAALSGLYKADDRRIDEYRDEVEAHLAACKEELFGLAVSSLMDKEMARLQLGVRNRTETNFPDVEVVLHIAGRVRGLEDLHVELPAKPRRFGTVASGLGQFRFPTGLGIPDLGAYDLGTGPIIDNSGSVTITFPVVDLRPMGTADLDDVDLLIPADGATSLTATWTATSSGADGVAEGTLELPIHPEPVNIGDLLPPP
jgi:hypothetical protein